MNILDERAIKAHDNIEELNQLINDYKPLIASIASRASNRHIGMSDDEMSVSMWAFVEAVRRYEIDKGHFKSYVEQVIRARIIDYMRTRNKEKYILISDDSIELTEQVKASIEIFSEQEIARDRHEEIQKLNKELAKHNIKFDDLVNVSPKSKKTREMCASLLTKIVSSEDLLSNALKGDLPYDKLSITDKNAQKSIRRHRKYIMAVLIVLTGDYEYIKDYAKGAVVWRR